jgi:hypothetical protein
MYHGVRYSIEFELHRSGCSKEMGPDAFQVIALSPDHGMDHHALDAGGHLACHHVFAVVHIYTDDDIWLCGVADAYLYEIVSCSLDRAERVSSGNGVVMQCGITLVIF